jgi:hypothetical protein
MRITHQKDFSLPDYNLSRKKLKVVNEFKDLGVIMTSNLSWSNQVAFSVKKANRILGLIKRTVGSFTPTSTFTTLSDLSQVIGQTSFGIRRVGVVATLSERYTSIRGSSETSIQTSFKTKTR